MTYVSCYYHAFQGAMQVQAWTLLAAATCHVNTETIHVPWTFDSFVFYCFLFSFTFSFVLQTTPPYKVCSEVVLLCYCYQSIECQIDNGNIKLIP